MRLKGTIVIPACALACLLWVAPVVAQEQSEPPATPDPNDTSTDQAPAEPDPTEKEKKKTPFGLYVYGSIGSADLRDSINSTIVTTSEHRSDNFVDLTDNDYARAAIGWKLPNKKGDFRAEWVAFGEDGYTAVFDGRAANLPSSSGQSNINVLNNLPWWLITIDNGVMNSVRNPPDWNLNLDANGNQAVDLDEVVYGDPDFENQLTTVDDLQNRVQHVDLLYGREWGGRRFSGRWFAGMRYSIYEGNVRAAAWLNTTRPGEGFTDGSLLRLLNFRQEYSGVGPTGQMEAQFNFFDRHVQLYLQGQVAFQVAELTVDSGDFFTFVATQTAPILTIPVATNLSTKRDKSTWQTMAEGGARWLMRNGVQIEVAYQIQGYLDVVLLPAELQIAQTPGQAAAGASAIFSTQDLVYQTFRFGVGFQF